MGNIHQGADYEDINTKGDYHVESGGMLMLFLAAVELVSPHHLIKSPYPWQTVRWQPKMS